MSVQEEIRPMSIGDAIDEVLKGLEWCDRELARTDLFGADRARVEQIQARYVALGERLDCNAAQALGE